ncbi:MAG: IS110 family transposase [bacterium]|nr:IS110 family transposase [bacterium]
MLSHHTTAQQTEYALLLGIDWADVEHEVCWWDSSTQQRTHQQVKQDPNVLHEWLGKLQQTYPKQQIAVALEQKQGALIHGLREYDFIDIYPVNPATSAQYRNAFRTSGAKDDPGDAELILDILTFHRDKLMRLQPEDALTRQLRLLTRKRRDAVNLRTRLNNQLKDLLKQYSPLFLKICGEDLFAPMACRLLLKYPCFDDLKAADPQELRQLYRQYGSWKEALITRRLKRIQEARPLTTDPALIQTAMLEARMQASLLLQLREYISSYDRPIAQLFPTHPDAPIFDSFPGAGAVFAPRLLAAFGSDRNCFQSPDEVHNTMGISPVKKASGQSFRVTWRKACPKFLRQSFQEYANESILHSVWAKAYYQMQRDRGNNHHAAVRALAFKWIRIMFRCWKTSQPYNELLYLKALQRRHAPLLAYLSKSEQVFGSGPK